jgi:hypothetical protein
MASGESPYYMDLKTPENAHGLGSAIKENRPLSLEPFGAGQVGFMQARPEALGDPGRKRIEMGSIARSTAAVSSFRSDSNAALVRLFSASFELTTTASSVSAFGISQSNVERGQEASRWQCRAGRRDTCLLVRIVDGGLFALFSPAAKGVVYGRCTF